MSAFLTTILPEGLHMGKYQKKQKSPAKLAVGFQGVKGAYSQLACEAIFKAAEHKTVAYSSFRSVFEALEKGNIKLAVLPLENSLAGSIVENYDLLHHHDCVVVGEFKLRVNHCLLGKPEAKLGEIQKVFSHPQALAQCSLFLDKMENSSPEAYFDTAAAALKVAKEKDSSQAAIASELAADIYGLKILRKSIENDHRNITRFAVLKKNSKNLIWELLPKPTKSSLILTLKSIPGALHKVLSIFAIRDIDLLKIESRPVKGKPWQYRFFIDCDGQIAEESLSKAISHLSEVCQEVKFLGSYPSVK